MPPNITKKHSCNSFSQIPTTKYPKLQKNYFRRITSYSQEQLFARRHRDLELARHTIPTAASTPSPPPTATHHIQKSELKHQNHKYFVSLNELSSETKIEVKVATEGERKRDLQDLRPSYHPSSWGPWTGPSQSIPSGNRRLCCLAQGPYRTDYR